MPLTRVYLSYIAGMSREEIAFMDGVSTKAVGHSIREYLKINDNETIAVLWLRLKGRDLQKKAVTISFKEYSIERESQNSFTVTGGNTVLRLDLNDKGSAAQQLTDTLGMSKRKAEKIFDKVQKQSVSMNTLRRVKAKLPKPTNVLTNKTRNRGSRK